MRGYIFYVMLDLKTSKQGKVISSTNQKSYIVLILNGLMKSL